MPLAGTPTQSIYPGDIGTFMGQLAIAGTSIAAANESLPAGGSSRTVVIAAAAYGHPVTQRQIIWQVFGSGSLDIQLEGSIDGVNFEVVDTYSGTGNSGPRIVQADTAATAGPQALSAAKIVSAARFWRVYNPILSPPTPQSITANMTAM